MENKFKLKFSRMFRSSLDSCRSKSISDVSTLEQPFFFPENRHRHHQLIELFSPKPPPSRPFPSFCRPKSPEHKNTHLTKRNRATSDRQSSQFKARDEGQIPKMTGRSSLLPPPANTMFNDCNPRPKHRRHRSKSRKTRQKKNEKFDEFFRSVAANYYGWYSSEDEKENTSKFDDDTTFFSSKSMSSEESSVSFRTAAKNNVAATEKSTTKEHWVDFDDENELTTKICSPVDAKVKDSFAVVKRSSDPYNDFRTSMVEMIVEKQIFGSKDLENLLQCFLSLNSVTHHRVIIEVFTEIWETLFSDWN